MFTLSFGQLSKLTQMWLLDAFHRTKENIALPVEVLSCKNEVSESLEPDGHNAITVKIVVTGRVAPLISSQTEELKRQDEV